MFKIKYLWLHVLIISGPLVLSFDQTVQYFRLWPAVFLAILVVGLFYIGWDAYFTQRGDWSFNPRYVFGSKLFGLPFEEVLFFVSVPFSCIFIYECVRVYLPDIPVYFDAYFYYFVAAFFVAVALAFWRKMYTFVVLFVCALFFLVMGAFGEAMLASSHFWVAMLICYLPFMVVNGVLTSLPVVLYNPESIIGIRITTIPLEDFFYNFAMLGFYFGAFLLFRAWLGL